MAINLLTIGQIIIYTIVLKVDSIAGIIPIICEELFKRIDEKRIKDTETEYQVQNHIQFSSTFSRKRQFFFV